MTVLDTCAVIALLREEPAADEVDALLVSASALLPPTCIAEVVDQFIRVFGVDEEEILVDLSRIGLLDPEPLTSTIAVLGARLRGRHYHRVRRPVSLADCIAAATARQGQRPLATSDPALLDLCAEEGIPFLALPGSDGTRHSPV